MHVQPVSHGVRDRNILTRQINEIFSPSSGTLTENCFPYGKNHDDYGLDESNSLRRCL